MRHHSSPKDIKIVSAEDVGHGLTEYKFAIQVKAATYEKLSLDEVEGALICAVQDAIQDNLGTGALDIKFVPLN